MKIEKTYLEDTHQLELIVETEQDVFDKAKHVAMREISKNVKIPGFRPGKAPYNRVAQYVGEDRIIDKALESFLDEIYPKVIEEIEETPYGPGQLEEVKSLEPPTLEFIVPLEPEVTLGDYRSIRIPFEASEVSEEDIHKAVEELKTQHTSVEEIEGPAEENNIVDTKITGRVIDADLDDEEALIMVNQPLPVLIKSEDEDDSKEWPFPGLSRQLLGVSPGDSLELVHEYPDEEKIAEDIRGKAVLYTVDVEKIRSRVLPELTDEFIQSVTDFETKEELLASIRDELEENAQRKDKNEYIDKIFDAILECSTVKFPIEMVKDDAKTKIKQLAESLASQGLELKTLLAMRGEEEETFQEKMEEDVRHQIPRTLLLKEIAETENLNTSPEDVMNEYRNILDQSFEEGSEERKEFEGSVNAFHLLNSISSNMITETALAFLEASAKGEDVSPFLKPEEEEIEDAEEAEVQNAEEEDTADEAVPTSSDAQDTPEDEEEAED